MSMDNTTTPNTMIPKEADGPPIAVTPYDEPAYVFFFVFFCFGVGVMIRTVLRRLHCRLPYRLLMLVFGGLIGYLATKYPIVHKYSRLSTVAPKHILMLFLPVLIFRTSFNIDAHTFMRSFGQIQLIGVVGFFITTSLTGIMVSLLLAIDISSGLLFGTLCGPTYPIEIVGILQSLGNAKHLSILLEGEGVLTVACSIIMFNIMLGYLDQTLINGMQMFMVFLRMALGGLLVGFLGGKITGSLLTGMYNDSKTEITITLVASFLTYYVAEELMFVSGAISLAVLGLYASSSRASLTADVDMYLTNFWNLLAYLVDTIIFTLIGVILVEQLGAVMQLPDVAFVIVTYILVTVVRFLMFVILSPCLSRIGYGMSWNQAIVAVWAGVRGAVPMCLTLITMNSEHLHELGSMLVIHIAGLEALVLLINATTMHLLMDILGMTTISLPRRVNMTNCLRLIMDKRDRCLSILKMDRFLADANWVVVENVTRLLHPYKSNKEQENDGVSMTSDEVKEDYNMGLRFAICPDCQREILNEPTKSEIKEMTKEAKLRILKAKKISYGRQYGHGMISKDSVRVLYQAVDFAMDEKDMKIQISDLYNSWKRKDFISWLRLRLLSVYKKDEGHVKPPRKKLRQICFKIVSHSGFDIAMTCIVLLNIIPITFEVILTPINRSETAYWILKIANTVFFLIYLLEFIMKVLGYSFIYIWSDGIRTYFQSKWNRFDFLILIVTSVDLIFDYLDIFTTFSKSESHTSIITSCMKLLRIIRVLRLLKIFKTSIAKFIEICDTRIDRKFSFGYDVGKGYVVGEEEVSKLLEIMIDNKEIRDQMRQEVEADRLAITRELGLIQKDRPWIAITVKTRQAIRTSLNIMQECITELKDEGWLDELEYKLLQESLNERLKYLRTHVKYIPPSAPSIIFKQVSWMSGVDDIAEFLYSNVRTKVFDTGDSIVQPGMFSDGIYIIVAGLFKLTFVPNIATVSFQQDFGALPIVDFITSTNFENKLEDYIVSGNSVGELSVLTNRPYDCMLTADTPSQAYVISHDILQQAFKRSNDPTQGLEARMWKAISIRLATAILLETPQYQSWTQDKIRFQLERAFVPTLTRYKMFIVNDMIEDVVLIEGIITDLNTRDCYVGPCYVPRTVQKIVFPKSSQMNVKTAVHTKLLIMPASDVDEFDIIENQEEISEVVSASSARCMQHAAHSRLFDPENNYSAMKVRYAKRLMGPHNRLRNPAVSRRKLGMAGFGASGHRRLGNNESMKSINSRALHRGPRSRSVSTEESEMYTADMESHITNGPVLRPMSAIFSQMELILRPTAPAHPSNQTGNYNADAQGVAYPHDQLGHDAEIPTRILRSMENSTPLDEDESEENDTDQRRSKEK